MNGFDGLAQLEYLGDDEWITTHELSFNDITVPPGFKTNLGTIPRVLWPFLAPFEIARPAIIHDYLYNKVAKYQFGRRQADRILRRACLADGVKPWKVRIIYCSVRLFGGFYV